MLKKLLKYDLKWIYKNIIIFYILAIFFACLGRLFSLIDNSLIFTIVEKICDGISTSMMVSSLINCIMRLWVRFIKNLYKDESYLTHTLPINIKTIYLSKVLTSIITIFTTVLVVIISLFICYYSKANLEFLKSSLELVASTYDTTVINLLLLISLVLFFQIMCIVLIGYVGIVIGHKSNKNKMLKSILFGFGIYLGMQNLTLILVLLVGFLNKDVMSLFKTTNNVSINAVRTIMYLAIGLYLVYDMIYYLIAQKQLEKGIDVD